MKVSKSVKLTQERLKELVTYDPGTGVFTRNICVGSRVEAGCVAGNKMANGYLKFSINKTNYLCHRLAWLYIYGYFPEKFIDHINRDISDNRIKNLREVSQQCNMRNSKQIAGTSSGVKGVSFGKRRGTWEAYLMVNYRRKFLGYYKSKDDAICARLMAEQCLNWVGCESNSPAYQYVQKNIIRKI